MLSVNELKSTLEKLGIHPSKSLGQHFLLDEKTLAFIIEQADIKKSENILEIGPGLGVLTEALARAGGNVYAVEKDRALVGYLKEHFHNWKNVTIIQDNALFFDPTPLTLRGAGPAATYKLVANLPYNISSPVLRKFLENEPRPTSIVVMVQKEVGERIMAPVGDSGRGILTVMVAYYGHPEIVGHVSRSKFWPQPAVDSVLLKITDIRDPGTVDAKAFFAVVRAGFSKKRAQIHNALKHSLRLPAPDISLMLEASGIDPSKRAEEFSVDEWATLARSFEQSNALSQKET